VEYGNYLTLLKDGKLTMSIKRLQQIIKKYKERREVIALKKIEKQSADK